ncbi:podocalyxin-like protein 2 [Salvelinus namaycush]|uniref:Podocalyxin-like protein 2 n=1 Tax=Salvelinus namaycush TaxID=8040 RepID=A0A8U1F7Z7_SALNM|nr:podocalyxin-like protein 2 [Salvelinus namaycush]
MSSVMPQQQQREEGEEEDEEQGEKFGFVDSADEEKEPADCKDPVSDSVKASQKSNPPQDNTITPTAHSQQHLNAMPPAGQEDSPSQGQYSTASPDVPVCDPPRRVSGPVELVEPSAAAPSVGEQAQGGSGPGEALPVEKQTDWEDHSVETPKESSILREHSEEDVADAEAEADAEPQTVILEVIYDDVPCEGPLSPDEGELWGKCRGWGH